jgi:hypothetical protein
MLVPPLLPPTWPLRGHGLSVQIAKIRIKRPYTIRLGMDAFLFGIMAICLCSGVNIGLEKSLVKKRSLFLALADLHKFLGNCSLSAVSSIQSLFRIKLLFMSTKMVPRKGP